MNDGMHHFHLRLPDGLMDRLRELAARDQRSVNAEMIVALQQFVERETRSK